MKFKFLTLVGIVLLFTSCESSFFSDSQSLNGSWNKNKKLNFTLEIQDKSKSYAIYFVIRNNQTYKYSNLWLFTDLKLNNKTIKIKPDTIQYNLADPKSGKWLGDGISTKEIKAIYIENFRFPKEGFYKFSIKNGMRDKNLAGIEDFGVVLEKNDN